PTKRRQSETRMSRSRPQVRLFPCRGRATARDQQHPRAPRALAAAMLGCSARIAEVRSTNNEARDIHRADLSLPWSRVSAPGDQTESGLTIPLSSSRSDRSAAPVASRAPAVLETLQKDVAEPSALEIGRLAHGVWSCRLRLPHVLGESLRAGTQLFKNPKRDLFRSLASLPGWPDTRWTS